MEIFLASQEAIRKTIVVSVAEFFENPYDINAGWTEISYITIGPWDMAALIFLLATNKIPRGANTYYLEDVIEVVRTVYPKIPTRWQPTYLSFFRVGHTKFSLATNFCVPHYLRSEVYPVGGSKFYYAELMFDIRVQFIKFKAPFIHSSEEAFQMAMDTRDIRDIDPKRYGTTGGTFQPHPK